MPGGIEEEIKKSQLKPVSRMFSGDTTPYFYHNSQLFNETFNIPGDDQIPSSPPPTAAASISVHSHPVLLYNLSILKEKIQQLQSFVSLAAAASEMQPESAAAAVSGAATAIQEIISAASSMMFAFQQVAIGEERQQQSTSNNIYTTTSAIHEKCIGSSPTSTTTTTTTATACDIIELDAADLLAKFTHYCHVCGKGFKRDANLRMHMRAHGDEYKTNLALTKHYTTSTTTPPPPPPPVPPSPPRKYSCPHEGCRWNKKHAKFQPLKSMVCVKNHYKRSHCPKMYVCNRCNRKQFSVLSDLKTHEKHCGTLSWMCTCGTTFSRKDKLMGHVTLFVGHEPVVSCLAKQGKVEKGELEMQMDFS